jgi:hypothetical protein
MNRFYVRKFLNRPGHHAGAYVLAVVESALPTDDPDRYLEIDLEIADCSRRVNLEFPPWNARDRANSVRKARLLAEVLAEFADAVEAEADAAKPRSKHKPRKRAVSDPDDPFRP